jgi:SPP1 gp7 family putative phage head morphogenesis protein
MSDAGTKKTDKEIKKLEDKLHEVYTEAEQDIYKKMQEFTNKFKVKEQIHLKELKDGKITQEQFDNWKAGQVFQGKQWENKKEQMVNTIMNTNKVAVAMVNGDMYGVFAFNSNYQAYQIEKGFGVNFGFGLYDTATVTNLIKNDPQILPKWKINEKKDYVWNSKKVNNAITQGIIQGESLDKISKRLSEGLCAQNENTMKTFARTGMTQAQNAGRFQRQMDAKQLGINLVKEWMATLDGRTRDSHRHMDGEQIKVGDKWHPQKFSNGCRYPGDPEGPPQEVYNCRCTLVADLIDYPSTKYERYDNIDGKPIKNMTYEEWAKAKGGVGHTKTKYKKHANAAEPGLSKLKAAENELAKIEKEIADKGADKVFSGIWKDQDITYADYEAKKYSIQSKKDYYEYQISKEKEDWRDLFNSKAESEEFWDAFVDYTSGPYDSSKGAKIGDLLKKYGYDNNDMNTMYSTFLSAKAKVGDMEKYLNDLKELEAHGEEYLKLLKSRDDTLAKVKSLQPKPKMGDIFGPNAYTQDRKDAALKASTKTEADQALRPSARKMWQGATQAEKEAAYDYTADSDGFNRPLRGYDGSWYSNVGVGKVDLNNEGKGQKIKDLTNLIDRNPLDQDVWLGRGVSSSGMAGFLDVPQNVLSSSSESELKQMLIGKEISDPAFMSCGSATGTGFGSDIKIYCPKGTKGIYVEPFSAYSGSDVGIDWDGVSDQSHLGGELETLLQRNTKFRVTNIEKDSWGDVKIEVEVIGQDPWEITY